MNTVGSIINTIINNALINAPLGECHNFVLFVAESQDIIEDVDGLRRVIAERIGLVFAESDLTANWGSAEGLHAENAFGEENGRYAFDIWECFFPEARPEAGDWKHMKNVYQEIIERC